MTNRDKDPDSPQLLLLQESSAVGEGEEVTMAEAGEA